MRYRAFISYSHRDVRWARWLHGHLERYRIPTPLRGREGAFGPVPDRVAPVLRDREEWTGDEGLSAKVDAALADAEALVVICSPAAARSQRVNGQVLAFKRMGRAEHIYCLVVSGRPHAGDELECFPPALHLDLDAKGELGTRMLEPVVADVRPGFDGKPLALMKLLSSLLGVELGTLRQHAFERRQRRLAIAASVAFTVALITSSLAIQSVVARKAAQRQQQQAEALVGFMLGDLTDKLGKASRLDVMESANDHALSYLRSLPTGEASTQVLRQRLGALENIGHVRRDQGDLPGALESYQSAEVLARHLSQLPSGHLSEQLALAQVLTLIGTVQWRQGRLDPAEADFIAAQRLLPGKPQGPAKPQLLYQRALIANLLGQVREGRGHPDQALAQYRDMAALTRQLTALDPTQTAWLVQAGLARNHLARMALLRGDLGGALSGYQDERELRMGLALRDPRNTDLARQLAQSHATVGHTLALTGAIDAGIAQLRQAMDGMTRLLMVDPGNPALQADEGLYAVQLAQWLRIAGQIEAARPLAAQGLSVFEQLARQDTANPDWQRGLARARIEQAEEADAQGARMLARDHLHAALHTLQSQLAAQPHDRDTLLLTIHAGLLLARASDDPAIAARRRAEALRLIQAVAAGRGDPRLLALQAEALLDLGELEQARALLPTLWSTGFRDPRFMALLRGLQLPQPSVARVEPGPAHRLR
jgi:tetratricopeptide (TPR) repeat protein